MKILVKTVYFLLSLLLILYVAQPNVEFPMPPPDSVQSLEPGDTETPLRRAYFTNFTREEVMEYYLHQFSSYKVLGLGFPTYRLNYPPEEAVEYIRDQTRSTFLEEIVHPLRESFYVNGFEPTEAKDAILIGGVSWRQKITVKLISSKVTARLLVSILIVLATPVIFTEWLKLIKKLILVDYRSFFEKIFEK
jgi:hypothetical protein